MSIASWFTRTGDTGRLRIAMEVPRRPGELQKPARRSSRETNLPASGMPVGRWFCASLEPAPPSGPDLTTARTATIGAAARPTSARPMPPSRPHRLRRPRLRPAPVGPVPGGGDNGPRLSDGEKLLHFALRLEHPAAPFVRSAPAVPPHADISRRSCSYPLHRCPATSSWTSDGLQLPVPELALRKAPNELEI